MSSSASPACSTMTAAREAGSERHCRSSRRLLVRLGLLASCGLTADNPAILWRYAGTLSLRLSKFRIRAAAEFHGAGRHRAHTEARRAHEGPLAKAEAEHASSGAASTRAAAAVDESVRRDEHTPTAHENTRTRGLNGRTRTAADRARRQHRWPYSSGIAAGANHQDRPDEVRGGWPRVAAELRHVAVLVARGTYAPGLRRGFPARPPRADSALEEFQQRTERR